MQKACPPLLGPGARVAVISPASPAPQETFDKGVQLLRSLGFQVVTGPSCRIHTGVWAGGDVERALELRGFLQDPSVAAIIATRGGVGCTRLLQHLDDLFPARLPPWIIGRSDLTALHLFFWGRFGWIGLSGPMVATDLGGEDRDAAAKRMLRIVQDPRPLGRLGQERRPLVTRREGHAEGPLIPANLSVLCSLVGSRFLPSLRGTILVIEEIDEPPQRIDRMLTQLRLSGALDGVAGLVLGRFTGCVPRDGSSGSEALAAVLDDHIESLGIPTLAGFPYGHEAGFEPLPVGVQARVETDPPALTLLEAAAGPPQGGRG